jgi:7,8-dihydroneopterin aldolase/epimerase/oxygenase
MDKIFVKNLVVSCKIGVTKEERLKKQNVIVDIEVLCDLRKAGTTDDLNKSISYSNVQEKITDFVTTGEFKLLERLAEGVASLILENSLASKVVVAVRKEEYAIEPIMGIEISRDRHG